MGAAAAQGPVEGFVERLEAKSEIWTLRTVTGLACCFVGLVGFEVQSKSWELA